MHVGFPFMKSTGQGVRGTDRPQRMAYAPMNGPPMNSMETQAESKNLLIDVLDTYRKVICPSYNHDPKTNGWGGILRSMI